MPGKLKKIAVQHKDYVQKGQPLIELENIELELTTVRLQGQLDQQNAMLDNLYYRAISDSSALLEIPSAEETLATIRGQLQKREQELGKLKLNAPADGTVLPAPEMRSNAEATEQLPTWEGSPLEEKNLNAFLTDDILVCQIGDPSDLEAVIAVDQADISFISVGQRVELFLDQHPGQRVVSRIDQIAKDDLEVSPRGLSGKAGGDLATKTDAAGREKPMSTTYQASARLQDEESVILIGTRGTAKIDAGSQTAASRLWRYLARTFNFEL
jgi:multidrug resistance efflux pump